MKKSAVFFCAVIVALTLCSCSERVDQTTKGVPAEIVEKSQYVKGIVVKSEDPDDVLGAMCYVNCENKNMSIIEVINGEPAEISFDDLSVGDQITIDVPHKVTDKYITTKRIQLEMRANKDIK
jgi:hypothetical protein